VIVEGLRRMVRETQDVFYYVTLMNENYPQLPMPGDVKEGILRGIYKLRDAPQRLERHVQLFGSGCAANFALEAQELLARNHGVSADVWNVTSYQQLRRNALDVERWNRLHPDEPARRPYLIDALGDTGPVHRGHRHVKLHPTRSRWLPATVPLGTDGFGMATRAAAAALEIDPPSVVLGALEALAAEGKSKKGSAPPP
jgi:pyruvate dehydrogenase E1 component